MTEKIIVDINHQQGDCTLPRRTSTSQPHTPENLI